MHSIMEMEPEQRDAILFWIKDLAAKLRKEGDFMNAITEATQQRSYKSTRKDAAARRRIIFEILKNHDGLTAREVSVELHRRGITPTVERNYAAPRLTELYHAGKITTARKKICPQTGRSVAVWTVKDE